MSECAQLGPPLCADMREYVLPKAVKTATSKVFTRCRCQPNTNDEEDQGRGESVSPPREQANALHRWHRIHFSK